MYKCDHCALESDHKEDFDNPDYFIDSSLFFLLNIIRQGQPEREATCPECVMGHKDPYSEWICHGSGKITIGAWKIDQFGDYLWRQGMGIIEEKCG